MFQDQLKDYAVETLLSDDAKIHEFFKKEVIADLLNEHNSNKFDHHKTLWQLIVLEEWLKKNTD